MPFCGRAGLDDLDLTDPTAFAAALLKERRTELFSEWGHRWFDLKRLGLIDEVMNQAAPVKGTSWNINKAVFAIPYADLSANGQIETKYRLSIPVISFIKTPLCSNGLGEAGECLVTAGRNRCCHWHALPVNGPLQ